MFYMNKVATQNKIFFFKILLYILAGEAFSESTSKSRTSTGRIWPSYYTDDHRNLHHQIATTTHKHLEDFQIVIPSKTDAQYNHVTYNIRHTRPSRVRRDTSEDHDKKINHVIHYRVHGLGQQFLIDLRPNSRLLSPDFYVKRMGTGGSEILEEKDRRHWGCHYHGRLVSHGSRPVALSTCDGLTGLLRTGEDDVIIEPVSPDLNHTFDSSLHPHVIYKKRHLEKGKPRLQYCGKGRRHPVTIPETFENKTFRLLSNGEIELETREEEEERMKAERVFRGKRSAIPTTDDIEEDYSAADQAVASAGERRPTEKSVETLVVADKALIKNHQGDERNITMYILTVMNMVSSLFKDRSLEDEVNIIIIGLVLLDDDSKLELSHRADHSLLNFCRWQSSQKAGLERKPDHSVLLTGIDICVNKNKPCGTLGLASIGGMCRKQESCTINEDIGLGLAFTVAHETGHSLGMRHDGEGNMCNMREGNIMSPTLNGLNGVFTWSQCSRESLKDFIKSYDSICMDDQPTPIKNFDFPRQLPGQTYDARAQCKWQFGNNTDVCEHRYSDGLSALCTTLWCGQNDVCETKYMPAAEGTTCGKDLWCRRGVCVKFGTVPDPIDGGWSEYGAWSECTRSCSKGVRYRIRGCTNPKPLYGGIHCKGTDKEYEICNVEECPSSAVSFREQQCSEFNDKPYRRSYYEWVPFTKFSTFGRGQCELLCKAQGYGFFDMLADRVEDGTPCVDKNNICIQGKCVQIGCDNIIDSNATTDACGVCKGDNSTCQIFSGNYDYTIESSGYYRVVRIPRGARKVEISEDRCCTNSYIAVKSSQSKNPIYHLNGNWAVDHHGERIFAGATWFYDRRPYESEYLTTKGPINEDLIIEILVVSENPGISWSYTMESSKEKLGILTVYETELGDTEEYFWNETFSPCTKACAGGSQTSKSFCIKKRSDEKVADYFCNISNRPTILSRPCNEHDCEARWVSDEWGECSRTCGGGIRSRGVKCMSYTISGDDLLPDYKCVISQKPQRTQHCQKEMCPAQWHTGSWSKCSRHCGQGIQTRTVYCQSGLHTLRSSLCNHKNKPKPRQHCLIRRCRYKKFHWTMTSWSQCSMTCGNGIQTRDMRCTYKARGGKTFNVRSRRCKKSKLPKNSETNKSCLMSKCELETTTTTTIPTTTTTQVVTSRKLLVNVGSHHHREALQTNILTQAVWISGNWQRCSKSCGGGFQMRIVRCLFFGRPSSECPPGQKPPIRRTCNTDDCGMSSKSDEICSDNFKWCYLVPRNNQCGHRYFGKNCCRTCREMERNKK